MLALPRGEEAVRGAGRRRCPRRELAQALPARARRPCDRGLTPAPVSSPMPPRASTALQPLRELVLSWVGAESRRLELAAAWRDVRALIEHAPELYPSLVRHGRSEAADLVALVTSLRTFLRDVVLPPLASVCRTLPAVASPYAGGLPAAAAATQGRKLGAAQCTVGIFNPGRTGFVTRDARTVLGWRLSAFASALLKHEVDVCVVPGARLPEGAVLPPNYPYTWIGERSAKKGVRGHFRAR